MIHVKIFPSQDILQLNIYLEIILKNLLRQMIGCQYLQCISDGRNITTEGRFPFVPSITGECNMAHTSSCLPRNSMAGCCTIGTKPVVAELQFQLNGTIIPSYATLETVHRSSISTCHQKLHLSQKYNERILFLIISMK